MYVLTISSSSCSATIPSCLSTSSKRLFIDPGSSDAISLLAVCFLSNMVVETQQPPRSTDLGYALHLPHHSGSEWLLSFNNNRWLLKTIYGSLTYRLTEHCHVRHTRIIYSLKVNTNTNMADEDDLPTEKKVAVSWVFGVTLFVMLFYYFDPMTLKQFGFSVSIAIMAFLVLFHRAVNH